MANPTPTYSPINQLTSSEISTLVGLLSNGQIRTVLLGSKTVNMNSTADQAITISGASKYIVTSIVATNASVNLTTAVGGIYPAASKGGTALVANTQVYSALTAATKYKALTLAAGIGTDYNTEATLYISLTTPQGVAATADVLVFGTIIA